MHSRRKKTYNKTKVIGQLCPRQRTNIFCNNIRSQICSRLRTTKTYYNKTCVMFTWIFLQIIVFTSYFLKGYIHLYHLDLYCNMCWKQGQTKNILCSVVWYILIWKHEWNKHQKCSKWNGISLHVGVYQSPFRQFQGSTEKVGLSEEETIKI